MAPSLTTAPRARWGIPLVLPHVLLSLGLLVFANASERPAPSEGVRAMPDLAAVTTRVYASQNGRS